MKYRCVNCGYIFYIDTNLNHSCPGCMKAVIYSWKTGNKKPAMHMVIDLVSVPDNYSQGEISESSPQED